MNSVLCIYEDANYVNLYPLSLTRPVFDLRCGMFSLAEKMVRHFPGFRILYCIRKELQDLAKENRRDYLLDTMLDQDTYFMNGRFLMRGSIPENLHASTAFVAENQIVGGFVAVSDMKKLKLTEDCVLDDSFLQKLPKIEISGTMIQYPWDLIHHSAQEIVEDFNFMGSGGHILGKVDPNVTLLAQNRIYLAPGAQLMPGVIIDGESGPVYISEGTTIMPNAVIQGPAFIGKNSRIKIGAKIYEGTSIGDVCKIGGEVEESIIHAFSNKQHEGFLGHSYLGEWVNLGADTNNSDLKNNYGNVKVMIHGKLVDSGSMFVGLFMGDHSKSGINTMFNTGTVVGVMCNIFGAGYSPKFIPSFTWGGIDRQERYDFTKAIETARRVMTRRKKTLSPAQENVLRNIFNQSEQNLV